MNANLRLVLLAACVMFVYTTNLAEASLDNQYSNLPPPPAKPDKFETREQLRQYLVNTSFKDNPNKPVSIYF